MGKTSATQTLHNVLDLDTKFPRFNVVKGVVYGNMLHFWEDYRWPLHSPSLQRVLPDGKLEDVEVKLSFTLEAVRWADEGFEQEWREPVLGNTLGPARLDALVVVLDIKHDIITVQIHEHGDTLQLGKSDLHLFFVINQFHHLFLVHAAEEGAEEVLLIHSVVSAQRDGLNVRTVFAQLCEDVVTQVLVQVDILQVGGVFDENDDRHLVLEVDARRVE